VSFRTSVYAVLVASLGLAGCAHFEVGSNNRVRADFSHTYPLQPGATVSVESYNGSVEIVGWDREEAEVSGTKTADSQESLDRIQVDIKNNPSSLNIRAVKPGGGFSGTGVRMTLRVPRKAVVDRAETSNGSVHVADLAGAARLRSSNGAVRVERIGGDLDARTSNGSLEISGVAGEARLVTSNGRIQVEGVEKRVEGETSNGSVKARLNGRAPVRLVSSNGSIEAAFDGAPAGDVRLETRNSSITLDLPAKTSARLSAATTNSSVSSEFEVSGASRDDQRRTRLEGNIGAGGPSIDLSTVNGRISIVRGSGAN